ncbi:MAG: rod shape-determining protein MreC [Cyanobacteriota/Melainabacteria group bacterium]
MARNPDNWFEQAVLDKGDQDGVLKGSAVITADGIVGQVVSTSEHAAVVRLDNRSRSKARCGYCG